MKTAYQHSASYARAFFFTIAVLAVGMLPAMAATESITVQTEATIRGGAYADIDQDEVTAGYLFVKYDSNLANSRKAYFQFDLSGINIDTNQAAIFTIDFVDTVPQAVTLWALDQDYAGFSSSVTWNQAQANDTNSVALLTTGSYTATPLATGGLIPATAPYTFTIQNPSDHIFNNHLTLVLTGVDNTGNDIRGLRIKRQNAVLKIVEIESVTVQTEATIRGGTYADIDQDEVTAGYLHVKYDSNLANSRKAYFQFDLSGINIDTNQAAIFTIDFVNAYPQAVTLWALDQDYVGFSSSATWNQAQANDTASQDLLTTGSYTATQRATGGLIPATAPYIFTIHNPGDHIFNNRLTLALTGVNHAGNNISGLRVKRQNAVLVVHVLPTPPPSGTVIIIK